MTSARPNQDDTGLAALAVRLADGSVTSRELVESALERIETTRQGLNAFRSVRATAALAEADAADRALAAGERNELLGVPIAIKDDTDIAGEPTAFGCRGDFPNKSADSEVVRRFKAAGAVIVGKTNTPEFGQWPFTEGSFGATRNPWHAEHSPGGSSGGSAAAVAAGIVPAALGSDGAGSVRIPSSWTNLVGIKPGNGRIPSDPDPNPFYGLTVHGPLGRTVGDAALLLDVAAGSGSRHRDAAGTTPRPLRVGLSLKAAFAAAPSTPGPEIIAAVHRLARSLSELGHEVVEANPRFGLIGLSFVPRSLAGVHDWYRSVPDQALLDSRSRNNARNGAVLRGPALRAACAARPLLRRQVGSVFSSVDVLLAPTTATPPPRIGHFDGLSDWETDKAMIGACPYAWPWNVLGWPGVNVPAGFTPDGLPVGAQLLGPSESEPLLISLAAELEQAERWHEHRPPVVG